MAADMYFVRAAYHATGEDPRFDLDYYLSVHVPLASRHMAEWNLKYVRREFQMNCRNLFDPAAPVPVASLTYYFDSPDAIARFEEILRSADVEDLKKDVARYTNCTITWTAGEVRTLEES